MITMDSRHDATQWCIVAALTPRGKRGELNFGACFELLDHLCKAKVQGIALLTAAGEYPAFTIEERTRLVYLSAKRSRAPLLAGVGSERLETSLSLRGRRWARERRVWCCRRRCCSRIRSRSCANSTFSSRRN